MKYKKLPIFILAGLFLISGIFSAQTAQASAPTGTSATLNTVSSTTVGISLIGTNFVTFVHSGTTDADSTDLENVTYNGIHPTSGSVVSATALSFLFPVAMGTGKSGGDLTVEAGTIEDAGAVPNALITITDGNITDFAAPQFLSQEITSSTTVTIIYSEPVITTSSQYTNFGGDLAGNSIASLTGSGTATIVLHLTTPVGTGAAGTVDINGTVRDANFNILGLGVGINTSVMDAQKPTVSSITPSSNPIKVADDGDTLDLAVNFSEAMDTGVAPDISFSENLTGLGLLTFVSASWTDSDTYTEHYTINGTIQEEFSSIDVTIETAKDLAGNVMNQSTTAGAFSVDTIPPDAPTASPVAGAYTDARRITLASTNSTSVHYTTNGATPDCSSGETINPVRVLASETVNAVGCDDAGNASSLGTFAYTITSVGEGIGGGLNPNTEEIPGYVAPSSTQQTGSHINAAPVFTRFLKITMSGDDVKALQVFLNTHRFMLASSGPGSSGNETNYFGVLTRAAVMAFQEKYKDEILIPLDLTAPTGIMGPMTIKQIHHLLDDRKLLGL